MTSPRLTLSQQKRQAILAAARTAFQADGVQNTSMDRLAELAQVSKRTVYNHFSSKEELVIEILSDLWQELLVLPDINYQPELDLQQQLSDLLAKEIELISENEYLDLNRVGFGYFLFQPEALQQVAKNHQPKETALERWIKSAVKDNKLIEMDAEHAFGQLHNLLKGSCFWPQLLRMRGPLEKPEQIKLAEESAAMFLSRYKI